MYKGQPRTLVFPLYNTGCRVRYHIIASLAVLPFFFFTPSVYDFLGRHVYETHAGPPGDETIIQKENSGMSFKTSLLSE